MSEIPPAVSVGTGFTTLPVAYTASPAYDKNTGWLAQYKTLFDYPTVLQFFHSLVLMTPFLAEADRDYVDGGAVYGGYTWQLDEKYQYDGPTFVVKANGQTSTYPATRVAPDATQDDLVQHTKDWLRTAHEWVLANVIPAIRPSLPSFDSLWPQPPPAQDGPGDELPLNPTPPEPSGLPPDDAPA